MNIKTYKYSLDYNNIKNRIPALENETNKSYTTDSLNQYTHNTGFSPMYDLDGNQTRIKTSRGIWNVTYNGENRPVKFIQSGTVISMNYDYMGRRFEKIVIVEGNIETSQKFMYDDYLQIEELNGNNESIKSYLWDPIAGEATRPLMLTDHALEQSFFFTHDANKNVVDLIDEGGMVAVHYEYSPFGAITLNTNPSFYNSFTFSSEYFDSELGLIYYNYRHYNPLNGRWISRDPIQEIGGWNLYGFVRNKQVNIFDRVGLYSCEEVERMLRSCFPELYSESLFRRLSISHKIIIMKDLNIIGDIVDLEIFVDEITTIMAEDLLSKMYSTLVTIPDIKIIPGDLAEILFDSSGFNPFVPSSEMINRLAARMRNLGEAASVANDINNNGILLKKVDEYLGNLKKVSTGLENCCPEVYKKYEARFGSYIEMFTWHHESLIDEINELTEELIGLVK